MSRNRPVARRKLWLAAAAMAALLAGPASGQAPQVDHLQEGLRAYSQRNFAAAIQHWGPLAQGGNPVAQYNLGRMYARAEGVRRDLPEAYKWFALASAGGRPEGERARRVIARAMTPVQMAEGLRRAEEWRRRRR